MNFKMKLLALSASLFTSSVLANIELNASGLFMLESEGEGVLYVTNLSENEVLVYAKEELEETMAISGESLYHVSPPVSKLKPYQKQLIRVILKKKDLKSQKLGRILIQEVPYIKDPNANVVSFAKSYNIPALVHPKGLVENYEPWKKAKLVKEGNSYVLINNSNYLIKMLPTFKCKTENGEKLSGLDSPYIMPNTKTTLNDNCNEMAITPVSNEGRLFEEYTIKEQLTN